MKKIFSVVALFLLFAGFQARPLEAGKKILVVYFSRAGNFSFGKNTDAVTSASLKAVNGGFTGNTEIIAGMIIKAAGGDIFPVKTVKLYPEEYKKTTDAAQQEQRENARPKLAVHVKNMDSYDVIFLGYPVWWGTMPMSLFTFLEEYDLSGKTIVPFCTHDGSSFGRSVTDIAKLCPKSTVLEGLAVRGANVDNAQKDVSEWLRKIKIIK